ncbi:MAG: hypothetical protein OHK0026_12530 [Rhodocyclaceae bacterium]
MKSLHLLRHAKSSWDDPVERDFDRPLNGRGHRAARRMGEWLRAERLHFDRVIASPATTAIAVVVTSASAAPTKTDSRDVPAVEKDSVASCVLSPSSATKTVAKVVATSFQSMGAGKHSPRRAGSFGCGHARPSGRGSPPSV